MTVWPWLREELDSDWPIACSHCGELLEVTWLTTTTRASDGVRRPGVGLTCTGCAKAFDWSDEDGYRLRRRHFGPGLLDPDARARG